MTKKTKRAKTASLIHERNYHNMGAKVIFGIDEAGRGPWAGPVSAGAVALPLNRRDLNKALAGVRDSKEMSPLQRESLVDTIKEVALAWGVGHASAKEIDEFGILPATKMAMQRALETAIETSKLEPDCLFLDYMLWPEKRDIPQVSIVSGDKHSLSIACASVLAKVWRDNFMMELDAEFPHYGFAQHKGYGTTFHREALEKYGPIDFHRQYYKPIQMLLKTEDE